MTPGWPPSNVPGYLGSDVCSMAETKDRLIAVVRAMDRAAGNASASPVQSAVPCRYLSLEQPFRRCRGGPEPIGL